MLLNPAAQRFGKETTTMDHLKILDELCAEHAIEIEQLAAKAGLDEKRVQAIVEGRWTPSPAERDKIAAVFGLPRDNIAWGHKSTVEHLQGHGPQFGRSP
jgi:transcriptional regulator with XRE-family HTH domain